MEPFEVDTPSGLSGLPIGASRAEVHRFFGTGWSIVRNPCWSVPCDFWPAHGVTAFYDASDCLFLLGLRSDNVSVNGIRFNALSFEAACAALHERFPDTIVNEDLAKSHAAKLAVLRNESDPKRPGAICLFLDGFEDVWMETEAT